MTTAIVMITVIAILIPIPIPTEKGLTLMIIMDRWPMVDNIDPQKPIWTSFGAQSSSSCEIGVKRYVTIAILYWCMPIWSRIFAGQGGERRLL